MTCVPWPPGRGQNWQFFSTQVPESHSPWDGAAIPSGPLGAHQPYLQSMWPDVTTEKAPRAVKLQGFAFLAHADQTTHIFRPHRPYYRGNPTPKIDQFPSVSNTLAPFGTAAKTRKSMSVCDPCPDHAPWDPDPGQPKIWPNGWQGPKLDQNLENGDRFLLNTVACYGIPKKEPYHLMSGCRHIFVEYSIARFGSAGYHFLMRHIGELTGLWAPNLFSHRQGFSAHAMVVVTKSIGR